MSEPTFLYDLLQPQLLISAGLGALIGLEREFSGKDPSLRTFALICLGSCLFAMLSASGEVGFEHTDRERIAAQIVVGIGFIGAGTIFRSPRGISGLTTAALMWVTAAIGTAVGFEKTKLAVSATLIALFIAVSLKYVHRLLALIRKPVPRQTAEELERY